MLLTHPEDCRYHEYPAWSLSCKRMFKSFTYGLLLTISVDTDLWLLKLEAA